MSTVVLMKKELMLNGLTCAHCASVIDEKVKHIDGVKNSNLNFTNKKLSVEIDCDNEEKIIKNIIDIINDTEPGLDIQIEGQREIKEGRRQDDRSHERDRRIVRTSFRDACRSIRYFEYQWFSVCRIDGCL